MAEQAITILDNNGVLLLQPDTTIAVIDPTADDPLAMPGHHSSDRGPALAKELDSRGLHTMSSVIRMNAPSMLPETFSP